MAQITIGNFSADMRLDDDWYGVPRLQQLDTFLTGFIPVRTENVIVTATTAQVREWDAANHLVTVTFTGNIRYGQLNLMVIEAQGIRLNLSGTFQANRSPLSVTGWASSESAYDVATNARLLGFSRVHEYFSTTSNSIDPDDATLLAGRDIITSGSGNDYLLGYGGADLLQSGGGADTLDGGAGADTMKGSGGDDTYYVNAVGDLVIEAASAGTDTIISSVSYLLGRYQENLTLTGSAGIAGTGNAGDNTITGNAGGNCIDGGAGRDRMAGGAGHDTYVVDNRGDVVTELPGQGTDTVRSSVTFTLAGEVERLTLTGTMAIAGSGNALNNVLQGNGAANRLLGGAGNDTLYGGSGNDTLSGEAGRDTFLFDTAPTAGNVDTLTDFAPGETIALDRSIFTALGLLGSFGSADQRFYAAAGATAGHDGNDRVVYDPGSGALSYDADGSGPLAAVRIAILGTATHPDLAATDLLVVV